jgi:hypothetical protein
VAFRSTLTPVPINPIVLLAEAAGGQAIDPRLSRLVRD